MLLGILRVSSPRLRRPPVETRPPEPLRDSDRLDPATDQNRATKRQPLPPCWSPARATPAPPSPARLSAPGSIAPCDIIVLPFATQIKHKCGTPIHDGPLKAEVTFCVQGVLSPLLANLFLHYAFDAWMARRFAHIRFERYADDIICHCESAEEARALWSAIADRLAACKLVLHPEKTKIVYCKDVNRRGDFPNIHFDFLGFQFRARKVMWVKTDRRIFAHSFQPAVSPKALTRISQDIRSWALHHRSDKSLTELAQMYNPCIRGWITYYSRFYKTQLRPTLKRIDTYVIRWVRRKFKRMRHQTKGARDWFDRMRRANPTLFAHWTLCHGNGRTSGAV